MDNRVDLCTLIFLVKQHGELYNNQHPEYSNHALREESWKKIGRTLRISHQECKSKWNRVRENFRKAINLRRSKGGQVKKPPRFYTELIFLLPHINQEEGTAINEEDSIEINFPSYSAMKESPRSTTDYQENNNSSDLDNDDPLLRERSSVMAGESSSTFEMPLDPDDTLSGFFLNMAKTVKTFPKKEQVLVKAQVFRLVNDIEIQLAKE